MKTQKQTAGFTLIELLVVISIISLLMSILLPALGAARATAKGVICGNNQRQIAIASGAYLADNRDIYPASHEDVIIGAAAGRSNGQVLTWGYALWDYVNSGRFVWPQNDLQGDSGVQDTNVFHCPVVAEHTVGLTNGNQLLGTFTVPGAYAVNNSLFSYGVNLTTAARIVNTSSGTIYNSDGINALPAEISVNVIEFTHPSSTIHILEASSESIVPQIWNGWAAGWLPHDSYKTTNSLFHDGHVKRLRYDGPSPSGDGIPAYAGWITALSPQIDNTVWTYYPRK